ncbi:MAG: Hsp20/alpha crystallin family protein [Vicinamibacterales bacterium]
MKVQVGRGEKLAHDLDTLRERVSTRAHELLEHRGGTGGHAPGDGRRAGLEGHWQPPVVLSEEGETVVVRIALAGVDPGTIDVRVAPDVLVVSAPAVVHDRAPGATVHADEFPAGAPARELALPTAIAPESARAEYRHGVLTVTARRRDAQLMPLVVHADEEPAPERVDAEC